MGGGTEFSQAQGLKSFILVDHINLLLLFIFLNLYYRNFYSRF